jgi:signal transduction histidine kinase
MSGYSGLPSITSGRAKDNRMKNELKILLLEDIAEEAVLIERAMRREKLSFVCKRVDTRTEFVNALQAFNPDVVLSDHALPQFNSIEALVLCRQFSLSVPFILVTGTVSEEFAVTCLKQGADDYVLKSNLSRLPSAILHSLNQREAEEKKKIAEDELRLQNDKLVRSNKQLVKINKELDNFVYSVSHNLRAPLSSVLGIINIARLEGKLTDDQYYQMIEESIHRLDETLMDILDYSRNARSEINIEAIDLKDLLYQNFQKLKYLPGAGQVELIFETEEHTAIHSDKYRLGMIFHNLISNSIKYSDPSKIRRYIKVRVSVSDTLQILFEDNGVGIKQDVLPKIYNMFFRGNEKSDGAGLGLYIVQEAIQKLHGTITVTSQDKVGTTFTVNLPILTTNNN